MFFEWDIEDWIRGQGNDVIFWIFLLFNFNGPNFH